MQYEGLIIRPPSEADSIILQVTVGCSHNRCTFCGTYKGKRFRIKDDEAVETDLDFAALYCRRQRRVFLADGDALIIPQPRLLGLLTRIRKRLPWITRISLYGNAKSILGKTPSQLGELKNLGLARVYLGLESGHDPTLRAIRKGVDSRRMIEAGRRIRQAGLFLSVTVLLGIAGKAGSGVHARDTGRVLTEMAPNQIAALTLMLLEDTPLYREMRAGRFVPLGPGGLLAELRSLIENIHLERVQFMANHASNYLPLKGRLKKDRDRLLAAVDQAVAGRCELVPESRRAL